MTHYLKISSQYLSDIKSGKKTFEIRKNDRNFKLWDWLVLTEWDEANEKFNTENFIKVSVTYLLLGGQFGIDPDYVVMSIKPFPNL